MTDDVAFEVRGSAGLITLRRTKALNALSLPMIRAIDAHAARCADDARIGCVVIRGDAKAFCAGGDVRAVRDAVIAAQRGEGDGALAREFFFEEYRLNARIARYPKPWIALVDGIAMGGGLGLSVHGSHRVVTERSVLAMPEMAIGMVPDVGSTWFLSRAPGELGTYLALTGARVDGPTAIALGLATHFVPSEHLDTLVDAIAVQGPAALNELAVAPSVPELLQHRARVDRAFEGADPAAIVARLEGDPDPFARETAKALRAGSPTSVAIALRLLRLAREASVEECLRDEYRAVRVVTWGHDFLEGIRAVLVDKDRSPKWSPARIEDVRDEDVARAFVAPPEGDWTS